MKKSKIVLLILTLCVFGLTACSNAQQSSYKSYVSDMANDGLISEMDVQWWSGATEHFDVETKDISVTFLGNTYDCTYHGSERHRLDSYWTHIYETEDGTKLGFSEGQNALCTYFTRGWDFWDAEAVSPDPILSYDELESIAKRIASSFIDLSEYTLEYELDDYADPIYMFRFYKYRGSFRTNDMVLVWLTERGHLHSLVTGEIGKFDNFDPGKIKGEDVTASIEEKLQELYGDYYTFTYSVWNQTIAFTPTHKFALVSVIEVRLFSEKVSDSGTLVSLSTILD